MKLYLIRHAKTQDSESDLTQRHDTSIIVNDVTLEKIEKIKNKIGSVDKVYCSPMGKAIETADLIFGEGNYELLDYIYEFVTPDEIIGKSVEVGYKYWEVDHVKDKMDINWKPGNGETFASIADRAQKLYEFLVSVRENNNFEKVAVIGHGTFLRHFLLAAANVPGKEYPQLIYNVLRKLDWDNLKVVELEI